MTTQEILEAARAAKTVVALASSETRTHALWAMSDWLCHPENMEAILAANAEDMAAAKGHISDVMMDRLALTEERIGAMARGILEAAALPDPVGRVLNRVERPNGLVIEKTAVPMGVIAIIYESRPNVTSDAAALAIKSGNACILRCGKEAAPMVIFAVFGLCAILISTLLRVEDSKKHYGLEEANMKIGRAHV